MKPSCKLIGENGNVFNLIGIVRATLRQNDLGKELAQFNAELEHLQLNGGSYDNVVVLIMKHVNVV